MKDYERDLCYYLIQDKYFYGLRNDWKELNRLYPDKKSVAFKLFCDVIELKIYGIFVGLGVEGDLYVFHLDLLQSLNIGLMAKFIIDFF